MRLFPSFSPLFGGLAVAGAAVVALLALACAQDMESVPPREAGVDAGVAPSWDGAVDAAMKSNCVVDLPAGSVTAFIDSVEVAMEKGAPPNSNAVTLTPGDASAATSFAALVAAILGGDLADACALPASYRVAKLEDPTAGGLVLVAELSATGTPSPSLYWGTYVASSGTPKRGSWLIEAPHPFADEYTQHQAADLFVRLGARALLVAGSHRCANTAAGACSGTTTACGSVNPYRVADAAHSSEVPFLAVHTALASGLAAPSFIQLHGNVEACPSALLSDGSGTWPARGPLATLAAALAASDAGVGRCGAGFPTTTCDLCGTDDIEGRAAAGSADACTSNGTKYGAMIHIEQQADVRTPGSAAYAAMLSAIDQAIP